MATTTRRASLARLQEQEYWRMARRLHDTVGQTIAALQMNLSIMEKSANQRVLAECVALTQSCADQIRSLSYDLYPPLLDEAGLLVGLRAYLSDYSRRTGTKIELVLPSRLGRLPRETEIGLFRIVQAALVNIHRISRASTMLRIRRHAGSLILELIHQANLKAADLELAGIRERARQIGSRLAIESMPDSLALRVVLPGARKLKAS
jgi:signal transduction histidine kinase